MAPKKETRTLKSPAKSALARIYRIAIEMGFIVFLFYSNLLMGEFLQSNGQGKTLAFALQDVFSMANFTIAVVSALIGYLIFEFLRTRR